MCDARRALDAMNYRQIFVHAVAAIKELDAKVKALEKRLSERKYQIRIK